ncbi:hypothetical protein I3843_03G053500 [Carya illinoinensis]|nr:hypothetical protein I3843_03G053500 [Carya illinoinensis]
MTFLFHCAFQFSVWHQLPSASLLPNTVEPIFIKARPNFETYTKSNPKKCIGKILERYRIHVEEEIAVRQSAEKGKRYDAGFPDQQMDTSPQQKIQRYLEEQNIEEKNIIELTQLEKELDMILRQTRFKKTQLMMEAVKALQDEQQNLRREKTQVEEEMAAMKSDQNLNDNHHSHALELESNPHANDYTPHFQEAMLHLF